MSVARVVPIPTERLRAVIAWLRLDADGDSKSDHTLLFTNEVGEPFGFSITPGS